MNMNNEEKFLLMSLDEKKSKKLAQAVSNESCRKILNYLANKEGTETEISKELNIPLSTVHYNLQQLIKTGLVIVEEYHYSKKGKEINHYKLANKYIIIAPKQKDNKNIKDILKKIIPVGAIIVVIAAIMRFFNGMTATLSNKVGQTTIMNKTLEISADYSNELARSTPQAVNATISNTNSLWSKPSIWFLIGGLSFLILYLLIEILRKKLKK
jgi:predicted transcriptional regulator